MSYGSGSSLGVESEDDKEGHLSPERHSSSLRWDRREQNNKYNGGERAREGKGGESILGTYTGDGRGEGGPTQRPPFS